MHNLIWIQLLMGWIQNLSYIRVELLIFIRMGLLIWKNNTHTIMLFTITYMMTQGYNLNYIDSTQMMLVWLTLCHSAPNLFWYTCWRYNFFFFGLQLINLQSENVIFHSFMLSVTKLPLFRWQCIGFLCDSNTTCPCKGWSNCHSFHSSAKQWSVWTVWPIVLAF